MTEEIHSEYATLPINWELLVPILMVWMQMPAAAESELKHKIIR
jgi:hypothetical protein